jgi:hypothetical protein
MEGGRSGEEDGMSSDGSGGKGMAMGASGFSMAEVEGGRESTVDVIPRTRRTTIFWTLCGFWEHENMRT